MKDPATEHQLSALIDRIYRAEKSITLRAIAKMHAALDECETYDFPDLSSQTAQAAWLRTRIDRDEGGV
jgi:hypothetical protein